MHILIVLLKTTKIYKTLVELSTAIFSETNVCILNTKKVIKCVNMNYIAWLEKIILI